MYLIKRWRKRQDLFEVSEYVWLKMCIYVVVWLKVCLLDIATKMFCKPQYVDPIPM